MAGSLGGGDKGIDLVFKHRNGEFPLIHPDGDLYRIFGQNASDVLAEERRLFYVACSRAKSKLYLLTEHGEISDFIPLKYRPTE